MPFDADIINEFLGTQLAENAECEFLEVDAGGVEPGERLKALYLVGEGFHKGTKQQGSFNPLAQF